MNAPVSRPFAGPVVVLTTADADRLIPLLVGRPDMVDLVARLQRATDADPLWREPIR